MSFDNPLQFAIPVIESLESLSVDYYIGGSAASSQHGIARYTRDVDICARLERSHVESFVDSLKKDYYVDADAILDALKYKSSFNLIQFASAFKVDVFIPANEFDFQCLQRAIQLPISESPPMNVSVLSAEDTILQKLRWYKAGNETSDQQWTDIMAVLKISKPEIDSRYLYDWGRKIGVEELLDRVFKDALGIDP